LDEIKKEYMKSGYRKSHQELYFIFEKSIKYPILTWVTLARKTYHDNQIFQNDFKKYELFYEQELKQILSNTRSTFLPAFNSFQTSIKNDLIGFRNFINKSKKLNISSLNTQKDNETLLSKLRIFNDNLLNLKIDTNKHFNVIIKRYYISKRPNKKNSLKDYEVSVFNPTFLFIRKLRKLFLSDQIFSQSVDFSLLRTLTSKELENKYIVFYPSRVVSLLSLKNKNQILTLIRKNVENKINADFEILDKIIKNSIENIKKQSESPPNISEARSRASRNQKAA
jgi:hypothetical protein